MGRFGDLYLAVPPGWLRPRSRRLVPNMFRKIVLSTCSLGLIVTLGAWILQLRGPIEILSGPTFRDTKWQLTSSVPGAAGWGTWDPTGSKPVRSTKAGIRFPFGAVEVPASEAPSLCPELPQGWLLLGVGYGSLHLGQAYFGTVPSPATPASPGNVYVTSQHVAVAVPLWMIAVLLAIYPSIAFFRGPLRRYRRRQHGLCLNCAYDLTANVSGVCPECGVPIDPSKAHTIWYPFWKAMYISR